jgi:DNA-binding response OmpR family regulator
MPISIVYLDDSEVSLEAVKAGLETLDFAVTTHRNPLTIYATLRSARPELLLLDANMPTLDGKTICSLVKRHLPTLPIVIFSSLDPAELTTIVAQCGADGYIVKTEHYARIAADVRRTIVRYRALAEKPDRGGGGTP